MSQTIIGVVVPSKWHADNSVEAVSIQGTDGVEYEVVDGLRSRRLVTLRGRRVTVRGTVEQTPQGARIDVAEFELWPTIRDTAS